MIIDKDFLSEYEKDIVQSDIITSSYFPWYWTAVSSSDDYPFYCHVMKRREDPDTNSIWFEFFFPIIQRFIQKHKIFKGKYEVLRAALNETLSIDENDLQGDPHVDYKEDHTVFLLYLNNSSGNTNIYKEKWKEGKKPEYLNRDGAKNLETHASVTPEEGKIICFDGLRYHSANFQKPRERRVVCIFAIKGEQNVVL